MSPLEAADRWAGMTAHRVHRNCLPPQLPSTIVTTQSRVSACGAVPRPFHAVDPCYRPALLPPPAPLPPHRAGPPAPPATHRKGKPSALPLLPVPTFSGLYRMISGSLPRALPMALAMPGCGHVGQRGKRSKPNPSALGCTAAETGREVGSSRRSRAAAVCHAGASEPPAEALRGSGCRHPRMQPRAATAVLVPACAARRQHLSCRRCWHVQADPGPCLLLLTQPSQ